MILPFFLTCVNIRVWVWECVCECVCVCVCARARTHACRRACWCHPYPGWFPTRWQLPSSRSVILLLGQRVISALHHWEAQGSSRRTDTSGGQESADKRPNFPRPWWDDSKMSATQLPRGPHEMSLLTNSPLTGFSPFVSTAPLTPSGFLPSSRK